MNKILCFHKAALLKSIQQLLPIEFNPCFFTEYFYLSGMASEGVTEN